MGTRTLTLLVAALLTSSLVLAEEKKGSEGDRPATLKVGAVASGSGSVEVFRALRLYLARNKVPSEFVLYSTYDGLNEALAKGQVDLAWNTPLAHAKFHLQAGASQTLVMRDVDVNFRVKLLARQDAGVSRLEDLAGKTMVFGSCD